MKKATHTIGLFLGIFWAVLAYAGGPFNEGVTEWSFSVGYGKSFHTGLKQGNVDGDIKFVPLLVSWGKVFKELTWGASLQYAVEGIGSYARQESKDRYMAGVTTIFPMPVFDMITKASIVTSFLLAIHSCYDSGISNQAKQDKNSDRMNPG